MSRSKTHLLALTGASLAAAVLYGIWLIVSEPLQKIDSAPERSKILNEMQKNGMIDLQMTDLSGQSFKLSDYRGKIIIVNFWASWCEPCVTEMPSLKKLVNAFKGDIILIALSGDHNEEDLRNFLKAFDFDSPFIRVAWDKGGDWSKKFGVMAMPESFLAGRDFKVVRKISGAEDWSSPQALEFFKTLSP